MLQSIKACKSFSYKTDELVCRLYSTDSVDNLRGLTGSDMYILKAECTLLDVRE
jgi:hypothetical protein